MLRPLILVCCFALAACSQTVGGYRQAAPSLAEPGADAVDTRGTYLDLIRRMQKQGAYYASLAHIDAFRQRHGDSPALRLLQADALRHTGQLDAAGALRCSRDGDGSAALGDPRTALTWLVNALSARGIAKSMNEPVNSWPVLSS